MGRVHTSDLGHVQVGSYHYRSLIEGLYKAPMYPMQALEINKADTGTELSLSLLS